MSSGAFTWVYDRVLPRKTGVSDAEKLLLLVLGDSHSEYNPCLLRVPRLAELLGWDEAKVIKTVNGLVRKKLISLRSSEYSPGELAFDMGDGE